MALTDFHTFEDSIRWRLAPDGVEVDGSGVERTKGAPNTVTRVWEAYAADINRTARARRVPCELIIATVCTESGGKADAVRLEPGYKSDEATPNKVSPGLTQTLISTASEVMGRKVDRQWLLYPCNAIEAGAIYIARQSKQTGFDPPLVAAAYNAGALKHQDGKNNRWKLRQFPIGASAHCDRFVQFFNDAVYVLKRHKTAPALSFAEFLRGDAPKPSSTTNNTAATRAQASTVPAISFGANAKSADVTPYTLGVLADILKSAQLSAALVSSTSRTPADQARIMYDNLEKYGVEAQKKLYANPGDRVIDVYARSKAAGNTSDRIKLDMETKIRDLGPTNVSRHTADPRVLNVVDIAPGSLKDRRAFEVAVKADERVRKFLTPADSDPAYHLEIPQPRG
jgi:hypothetical protein